MGKNILQTTEISKIFASKVIKKGDICIDCTCGNGNDTLFLYECTGPSGKVIGFDIQEIAVENTKKLLLNKDYSSKFIFLDTHENIANYADVNSISCIMYNLGYLPKADHKVQTNANSTIKSLCNAIKLLKKGGIISICAYEGKDTDKSEKESVLEFTKKLGKDFSVVVINQHNKDENSNPPVNIIIQKIAFR